MPRPIRAHAAIAALFLAGAAPASAAQPDGSPCPVTTPAKPAKKGVGLGGLFSAAKRAGVGDLLGAGVLGGGRTAQVAGAVAGTAITAADGGDTASAVAGTTGDDRAAQAAGLAAGTVVELARQTAPNCG